MNDDMTRQPGWYRNPDGPGERWHDGRRWTGVTRLDAETATVVARTSVRAERRQRSRMRLGRVVVGTLVAAAVAAIAVFVPVGAGPGDTVASRLGLVHRHRLLPEVPTSGSSNYAILKTDLAGDPVTYDPCRPVEYVVNPAGAPSDYMSFIAPAIKAAEQASGLKFVYDGTTTATADSRRHTTKREPILIAFPDVLDGTAATPDEVGLGGSTAITVNGAVQPHYLTGSIELLSSWFNQQSARHNRVAERGVVMHELGHVLGLGHVQDPSQIMYPAYHGQADYGAGDLAGLALEGDGRC